MRGNVGRSKKKRKEKKGEPLFWTVGVEKMTIHHFHLEQLMCLPSETDICGVRFGINANAVF